MINTLNNAEAVLVPLDVSLASLDNKGDSNLGPVLVHKGYQDAYLLSLVDILNGTAAAVEQFNVSKVVISGHSQGKFQDGL